MDGKMIAFEPPSHLEYQWGEDTLRFDLKRDGAGTLLTFVNRFDERGRAARDAAGWHVCGDLLGYHLDGDKAPWTAEQRWQEVHTSYVEQFGPEASTIGPPEGHEVVE